MGTNDVPGTGGLSSGTKSKKDPTGWGSALNATIDASGTNISTGATTTYAQLYQAINSDAVRSTSKGTLWGEFAQLLRAKNSGYGYSKSLQNNFTAPFGSHDEIALKKLLTSWYDSNASATPTNPAWSLSQFYTAQRSKLGNTATQVGPTKVSTNAIPKVGSVKSTATPGQIIDNILQNEVIPRARALGSNLSSKDLSSIASDLYHNGTSTEPNMIEKAITDKTNIGKVITQDTTSTALGGAIGANANDARTIFHNYGIPVPKDPNQFAAFIKNSVGVGGDLGKVTEYAKAQAGLLYPWMKGFLTGSDGSTSEGGTVAGYLAPFTSNIATIGGISPATIDWTDPKWQSVITTKDPKTGINTPNSVDQAIQIYKTDPRFGYDKSVNGINDGAAQVAGLKSAMGL